MKLARLAVLGAVAMLAAACTNSTNGTNGTNSSSGTNITSAAAASAPNDTGSPNASARIPKLDVQEVAGGLQHGWDIGFLPDGKVLITERPGRLTLLDKATPGASATRVEADFGDVNARGEGGLMGLLIHPDFGTSRQFTTCQTHWENGAPIDVRLITWELAPDYRSARRIRDPLIGGLPVNPSGRHSGCRPTMAPDGAVLIGTGDSARANVAQDRTLLGGKVLRIDLATGGPRPGNPWETSSNPAERLIWTYGHRNVQGVAIEPGTGRAFVAEHGPSVDDEVNLLQPGGNYGWDPSRGGTVGGYNERIPMTDKQRFPDAVDAVWTTGDHTEAICAAAFLYGDQWGALSGALALTALKGSKVLLLTLDTNNDTNNKVTNVSIPAELDDTYGRLRAARLGPDGALYVTTSNGSDDRLLRITPV